MNLILYSVMESDNDKTDKYDDPLHFIENPALKKLIAEVEDTLVYPGSSRDVQTNLIMQTQLLNLMFQKLMTRGLDNGNMDVLSLAIRTQQNYRQTAGLLLKRADRGLSESSNELINLPAGND